MSSVLPDLLHREKLSPADRLQAVVERGIREGLHAMAQPLTILQSRVEAAILFGEDASAPELMHTMAGEIERLCSLLRPLQELVQKRAAERSETTEQSADLAALLASVAADVGPFFSDAGAKLCCAIGEPLPRSSADPGRVREIVQTVLLAAQAVARVGDEVVLSCRLASFAPGIDDELRINVRSLASTSLIMSSLNTVRLSVAQRRAMEQGGDISYAFQPFCCEISLPVFVREANSGRTSARKAVDGETASERNVLIARTEATPVHLGELV